MELLSPAGSLKKVYTAFHFGADAVYLGGKDFSLRAYAGNLTDEEITEAVAFARSIGKKVYVTINIFASNADFARLYDYADFLNSIKIDAVIVSDAGIVYFLRKHFPSLNIHLSTQANTTNKYALDFWIEQGISRVVLARELSLESIKEAVNHVKNRCEIEVFAHGAMCISYSGRCLLSNYLSNRDANRGECVQACRWHYGVKRAEFFEVNRGGEPLTLAEDERGSYILNSKDLNVLPILDEISESGVKSIKIEGRMKSEYYIAAVTNAYRRALDGGSDIKKLIEETEKVNHREYTTGFYKGEAEQCYFTSKPQNDYIFIAETDGYDESKGLLEVTMRNRFKEGDVLEILSPKTSGEIRVDEIFDANGERVTDCKLVQQKLFIKTDKKLARYDILRKKIDECGAGNRS